MEAVAPKQKRGNPLFGKKEVSSAPLKPKRGFYEFVLTTDYSAQKPRDKDTNEIADNPYPYMYIVPNAGVAWNPETQQQEEWRYLFGYNSIWVKDQLTPEPNHQRLTNVDGKNDIFFIQGHIKVKANDEAKFQALMVQDVCEDNDNKINLVPSKYKLVNESKERLKLRKSADDAFLAEKAAREASIDEILPIAMVFGINLESLNGNEEDLRTEFILKAKQNPDTFLKVFNDPKNKIKYLVSRALSTGIIVSEDGKLSYKDTGAYILSLNPDADVPDQVSSLAIGGDKKANELYQSLRNLDL